MPVHPLYAGTDPRPTPSRRHWLLLGLGSGLVLIIIICSISARLAYRAEQQRRAAARIPVLQEYADWCQERHEKIHALFNVNAKGGEADNDAASERDLWKARAELALAEGDRRVAIADLKAALKSAIECRNSETNSFSPRPWYGPFLSDEHEASATICEIKLKLVELSPEALDEAP